MEAPESNHQLIIRLNCQIFTSSVLLHAQLMVILVIYVIYGNPYIYIGIHIILYVFFIVRPYYNHSYMRFSISHF